MCDADAPSKPCSKASATVTNSAPPCVTEWTQPHVEKDSREDQCNGGGVMGTEVQGHAQRRRRDDGGTQHPQHALVGNVQPATVAAVHDKRGELDSGPALGKKEVADQE